MGQYNDTSGLVNPFFNNYNYQNEQDLLENLYIENLRQTGIVCYYLPRDIKTRNDVFREATVTNYDLALPIAVHLKTVDGWGGDGKLLSKFGLEIRDSATFEVAKKSFQTQTETYRPMEGDLIFFPFNQKLFQITFNDHEKIFYQHGKLYSYELSCDLFEYANEKFATGIADIDDKYNQYSLEMSQHRLHDTDGNVIESESGDFFTGEEYSLDSIDNQAQNEVFEKQGGAVLDFNERDPFSENGKY